ncbi:MAG TPA: glycosyltransferase family 2 protein [Chlamydiae bacterium]|nr:glycosyltransferase family 2 protein [Chlamydiota bacterium]
MKTYAICSNHNKIGSFIGIDMQFPKISIIMSNYNYAHFLHESLGSIVKQTHPPFECIVIDDCSTDNSVAIIKKYQKDYSFIKLIQNDQNKGVMHNVNHALKISKGEYVYSLSSDDRCSPYFIEKAIKLLTKYPQSGLCCSIPCFIKENGEFSNEVLPPEENIKEYISPSSINSLLEKGFFIAGHTSIIKKKYLLQINGFIPELKWHCDWFALIVIALRYGFCYSNDRLAFLRLTPKSYSSSAFIWKSQKKVIKELISLLEKQQFSDVKNNFYKSKVILYLPYVCIYFITNFKYWFSLTPKIWKDIFNTLMYKDLLEKKHFLLKVKNFLSPLIRIKHFLSRVKHKLFKEIKIILHFNKK